MQQVKQIQAPKNTDFRHQPQAHTPLHERLSAWLSEHSVEEGLGGPLELLRWLSRCLLTIGGRSIGHLYSYLDRHDPVMSGLIQSTGAEVSCALQGYVSFPGQLGRGCSSVADSPPPRCSILLLRVLLKGCTGSIFHHPCAMFCAAHKHQCAPPALPPLL